MKERERYVYNLRHEKENTKWFKPKDFLTVSFRLLITSQNKKEKELFGKDTVGMKIKDLEKENV